MGVVLVAALSLMVLGVVADPTVALASPSSGPLLTQFAGTGSPGPVVAGSALSSPLPGVSHLAIGPNGDIYMSDQGDYELLKVTPSGQLSIIAGNGTDATEVPGDALNSPMGSPNQMAVDSQGDVYFADLSWRRVYELTAAGNFVLVAGNGSNAAPTPGAAVNSGFKNPEGVAVDAAGDLYVGDGGAHEVVKISPVGTLSIVAGTGSYGAPVVGPATASTLGQVNDLADDPSGNLYVADPAFHVIEKVTPAGALSIFAGTRTSGSPTPGPATASNLKYPLGLTIDAAGDLFIADSMDGRIDEVTPAGTISVVAGDGTNGAATYGVPATSSDLWAPQEAVGTPGGTVYIANLLNYTIDKVVPLTPAGGTPPSITGTTVSGQTLTANPTTWASNPASVTYQWQDCDATGAGCVDIAGATDLTYTLAAGDVGHTVRVVATASNDGGTATQTAVQTALVTVPTLVPPPVATPTPTGVGQPVNQIAPTIAGTPAIGQILQASVGGWTGPAVTYRYQWLRDGVAIPGATGVNYRVSTADSGHKLSVEVVASDGTTSVAAASQTLTALAVDVRGCTAPSGRLTAGTVGGIRLGMNRTSARRLVASTQRLNGYTDNLCLAGGYGMRVGYANATMLGHGTLRSLSSRIVFAVTANPYYTLDGARPGMTVSLVAKRLHLGRPITIGPNTWYVIPGTTTNHVLKTRHGVIQEIGILNRALTITRSQQGRLLRLF